MDSDSAFRKDIRQKLKQVAKRLECDGDIERQHELKMQYLEQLVKAPIAAAADKANEQMYEVPNEFFMTVFGKALKCSSSIWPEGVNTLDEAEEATLALCCKRARLEDGHTILDIGGGWGALGLYIVEKYPKCRVVSVSNSSTQKELIDEKAKKLGVSDRLEAVNTDISTYLPSERYDRIFTFEVLEYMKNYKSLFHLVSTWLKSDGLFFVQTTCHKHVPLVFDPTPGSDTEWVAKTFFTGVALPSSDLYMHFQEDLSLVDIWMISGKHYSRTWNAWLLNLKANKEKLRAIFNKTYGDDADQQLKNWHMFLIYGAELWGCNGGNEWHLSHQIYRKKHS